MDDLLDLNINNSGNLSKDTDVQELITIENWNQYKFNIDNSISTMWNFMLYNQFNNALKERNRRGHYAEITFIGINSAIIKEHKKIDKIFNVTVDFIAEVITCIKDKDKKVISGNSEEIKKMNE